MMNEETKPPVQAPQPAPRVSLQGVITKIKDIAADQYEGKVYDNILSIFNQLETPEKRVFLKGLINLCFIVEDRILADSVTMNQVKTAVEDAKETIQAEIGDIEKINKIELIRLKSWFVKAGAITILGGLLGVCLIVVYFNQDGSDSILENFQFLKRIYEVLKTAIGL